jgi:hypothetical protein
MSRPDEIAFFSLGGPKALSTLSLTRLCDVKEENRLWGGLSRERAAHQISPGALFFGHFQQLRADFPPLPAAAATAANKYTQAVGAFAPYLVWDWVQSSLATCATS